MKNNFGLFDWRETFLHNWGFSRVVRLLLSIVILYEAFQTRETFYGIAGVLFLVQAVFNWGCCGMNSCSTQERKMGTEIPEDFSHEEIKVKGEK